MMSADIILMMSAVIIVMISAGPILMMADVTSFGAMCLVTQEFNEVDRERYMGVNLLYA